MVYCFIHFNEYEPATDYSLHYDSAEQAYYWVDDTHEHILPELFRTEEKAIHWIITCCDEIGADYNFFWS